MKTNIVLKDLQVFLNEDNGLYNSVRIELRESVGNFLLNKFGKIDVELQESLLDRVGATFKVYKS